MNTECRELLHRIDVCGRAVRHLGVGELRAYISEAKIPCEIVRGDDKRVLYSFSSLEECEEWCDYQMAQEWEWRVSDSALRLRRRATLARDNARKMKAAHYDIPWTTTEPKIQRLREIVFSELFLLPSLRTVAF